MINAVTMPQEHEAHKAQILEFLQMGYTDKEIVTLIMDSFASGTPRRMEWRRIAPSLEHQIWEWLRQVKEQYVEYV